MGFNSGFKELITKLNACRGTIAPFYRTVFCGTYDLLMSSVCASSLRAASKCATRNEIAAFSKDVETETRCCLHLGTAVVTEIQRAWAQSFYFRVSVEGVKEAR